MFSSREKRLAYWVDRLATALEEGGAAPSLALEARKFLREMAGSRETPHQHSRDVQKGAGKGYRAKPDSVRAVHQGEPRAGQVWETRHGHRVLLGATGNPEKPFFYFLLGEYHTLDRVGWSGVPEKSLVRCISS